MGMLALKEYNATNDSLFRFNNGYTQFPCHVLDTNYITCLKAFPINDSIKKNLSQPIQAWYFEDGKAVSNQVNCFAILKGFKNLDWNHFHQFERFPPTCLALIHDTLSQEDYFNLLQLKPEKSKAKYTIAIAYTLCMERQSKNLIDLVLENRKMADDSCEIILINQDKVFVKAFNN